MAVDLKGNCRPRQGKRLTVPNTSKNCDGISFPIWTVETVKTPMGNVKPHHPMLKGNLLRLILASAKKNQTRAKPHIISAIRNPTTYRMSPALVVLSLRVLVTGKIFIATTPSSMIAKPPWPKGPSGRKTETITSRGGSL